MKTCKCSSNNKCFYCTRESNENNLCVSCNYELEYYPKIDEENGIDGFINCYKNPEGYYLDGQHYVKCYSSCKSCNILGNETDNKCIECKSTHEKKNDFENDNNCYIKCQYNYYYDSDNKYQCTNESNCPVLYNKLIREKKRCIDECKNDNIYKYEYKNLCYKKCPEKTKNIGNQSYLCEEIIEDEDKEKCILKVNSINLKKNKIGDNKINLLTKNYSDEYGYSDYVVSKYENKDYTIYIYKNLTCLQIKANEAPLIDFGECYKKIKSSLNITNDLIITLINFKAGKNTKSYSNFF